MSKFRALLVASMVAMFAINAVPASADSSAVITKAINWAENEKANNPTGYYERCLPFVEDAYSAAGVDIGRAPNPVTYWADYKSLQHTGDTNPPAGALVVWGATSTNSDGHIALSLGGGVVISSYERSNPGIHEFKIVDRNAAGYPYLGWMMPPGVSAPSSTGGGSPGPHYANGTIIRAYNTGRIYVVAGGSPMYVSNWAHIGGPRPVNVQLTQAQVNALRSYPADGTLVIGYQSSREYQIVNQAAVLLTGTSEGAAVTVDDWAIDNQLHPAI